MPANCQWPDGCAEDGVPDGVPVFNVTKPDSDELLGVYCRVHAMKTLSRYARERRRNEMTSDAAQGTAR